MCKIASIQTEKIQKYRHASACIVGLGISDKYGKIANALAVDATPYPTFQNLVAVSLNLLPVFRFPGVPKLFLFGDGVFCIRFQKHRHVFDMKHPLPVLLNGCNQRARYILCAKVDAVFGKQGAVEVSVFLDILFPSGLRRVKFCALRLGKILLEICNGVGKLRLP